jgi:NADH-quinone oxidoreductase subunit N
MANDLIFLFLALELISIPTYILLYLPTHGERAGQEAAIKYFLLSVMSSAVLLFGFSYLYGLSGTTNISAILKLFPRLVAGDSGSMAVIAAVMVIAGLGFKITAFPFHFYAPDVYQGGPSGVVALLAFVPKVAGFVALLRLFNTIGLDAEVSPHYARSLMLVLWVLSAVTMTAGNVLALLQNNVRRMLAYSSVAHAGYMLIALVILPAQAYRTNPAPDVIPGGAALLFYLVAYGAMTVGVFAVLAFLYSPDHPVDTVDDLAGLHERHPVMAAMMALFLFSFIGMPLTAGFVGKFLLFFGALAAPTTGPMQHLYQVLALVGAINAAVGAYYYLRVAGAMYLRSSFRPPVETRSYPIVVAVAICAVVTIWFGVYPWPLLDASRSCFPAEHVLSP